MTVIPLPVPAERRLTARRRQASPRATHAASDAGLDAKDAAGGAASEANDAAGHAASDAASDAGVPGADAIEAAAPPKTQPRAQISGTFTSPTGRVGRMTGQARVRQIRVDEEKVHAYVVFTGQLCDADGSAIGTGSRRATAPAATAEGPHGRAAVIGPVEVDLLGLAVSVRPFVVGVDVWPSG